MPFLAACLIRPVKAFKDPWLFLVRYSDAVVGYQKLYCFFIIQKRETDLSVFGRIAERVVQQDGQHLSDPLGIAADSRNRVLGKLNQEPDRLFGCGRLKGFKSIQKKRVQFHRFLLNRPA